VALLGYLQCISLNKLGAVTIGNHQPTYVDHDPHAAPPGQRPEAKERPDNREDPRVACSSSPRQSWDFALLDGLQATLEQTPVEQISPFLRKNAIEGIIPKFEAVRTHNLKLLTFKNLLKTKTLKSILGP